MIYDEELAVSPAVKEQAEEHLARADVYRLLAALLASPPTDALLNIIRNFEVTGAVDDDSLTNTWHLLQQAAQQAKADQLQDEYFNLFIGLGKGELSPYASWYLTGFLMEKPLADLRTELSRLGFDRQADVNEPEDHVAALCEVMSVIIAECELSFEEEKLFFSTYVAPWMGRFFDDLYNAQSAKFYKPVGLIGKQFIDIEQRYFSMPV
ncbi:TorD/DmsD family molecular chaperone [Kaarinaea lacus]